MRRLTWLTVGLALAVGLTSCGLYGEKGFTGHNPLSAERFVAEVDDECREVNESLHEGTAFVLGQGEAGDEAPKKLASDLRGDLDELIEQIDAIYGPDELEKVRDDYSDTLDEVRDQLEEVRKAAVDDDEQRLRATIATVKRTLAEAETSLRAAGFEVCGLPRPA